MRSEQFDHALSQIKDEYILEAMEDFTGAERKQMHMTYKAIAACMIVLFLIMTGFFTSDRNYSTDRSEAMLKENLISGAEAKERLESGYYLTDPELSLPDDYEIKDVTIVFLKDKNGKESPYYCFSILSKDASNYENKNRVIKDYNSLFEKYDLFYVPAKK